MQYIRCIFNYYKTLYFLKTYFGQRKIPYFSKYTLFNSYISIYVLYIDITINQVNNEKFSQLKKIRTMNKKTSLILLAPKLNYQLLFANQLELLGAIELSKVNVHKKLEIYLNELFNKT